MPRETLDSYGETIAGKNFGTAEAFKAPLLKIPDSFTDDASSLLRRNALGEKLFVKRSWAPVGDKSLMLDLYERWWMDLRRGTWLMTCLIVCSIDCESLIVLFRGFKWRESERSLSIEELVVKGIINVLSIDSYWLRILDMSASIEALTFVSLKTTYDISINWDLVILFLSLGLFS